MADVHELREWLTGQASRGTWVAWHTETLARVRDDAKTRSNQWEVRLYCMGVVYSNPGLACLVARTMALSSYT